MLHLILRSLLLLLLLLLLHMGRRNVVMHLMMIRMVLLRRIPSGRYHSPSSSAAALLLLLLATAVIVIVIIFVVVVVVIARVVCVQEYVPGGKVRIALRSLSVVLLLSSIRRRMERILLHSSGMRGRRVETSTRENDGWYHPVLITVITITTRPIRCFGAS